MQSKIAMVSLGCSKNLIDSELMMGLLDKEGYKIVDELEDANVIIVNTCGFIESAKEESIDTILEMSEYKKYNCNMLIVSGCLSERYKKILVDEMPEIDAIIGTGNIIDIVDVIKNKKNGKIIKVDNINNKYLESSPRKTLKPEVTSYIKISEGCDNFCTYCIIPKLRGRYRSRKIESIIKEAENLVRNGTREIILIAQDTSKYGIDLYGEYKLDELLNRLNGIDNLNWIRILYMYPETFSDELIDSINNNEKVLNYVDIPIQHISNKILNRMNRNTNKKSIIELITNLRKKIPNIIIRSTLIVGFPGETNEDFEELYRFVKDIKFDRLGIFTYSREEDTPAGNFKDQIDEEVKQERRNVLMELQQNISEEILKNKIDMELDTIIEEKIEKYIYIGRTYMDSPEIDGNIYIHSNQDLKIGDFKKVKIDESYEYDVKGNVVNEFTK